MLFSFNVVLIATFIVFATNLIASFKNALRFDLKNIYIENVFGTNSDRNFYVWNCYYLIKRVVSASCLFMFENIVFFHVSAKFFKNETKETFIKLKLAPMYQLKEN